MLSWFVCSADANGYRAPAQAVTHQKERDMNMIDPERSTRTGATEVRGRMPGPAANSWRNFRETKPSFMTTEFWLMLAGIAALVIIYNVADDPSLDLFR